MNRRAFLSNVAVAGAAVGLLPVSSSVASPAGPAVRTAAVEPSVPAALTAAAASGPALTRAFFARMLQSRFAIEGEAGRSLELIALRKGTRSAGLEQFFVVFLDVSDGRRLQAGIYALAHPSEGVIQLYLEPVTGDPRGACYRATLCLLA